MTRTEGRDDRQLELADAMRRFRDGNWSVRALEDGGLGTEFNRVADAAELALLEAEQSLTRVREVLAERQSDLLAYQRRLAAAERLAALGAMAARLAHELGTPLHSVAGHLDLLLGDGNLPAPVRERARTIAGEVDRLSAMIRMHLKALRSPQPHPEPTNLNALLERIAAIMGPLLQARSIRVRLDLAPGAAALFDCDPRQVEQVVLNLVQNALDAMPDGGQLVLRSTVTRHGRAISVADDGYGVEPEFLDRVFEPFFSTKRAGRGTGLGLSLCKEIAQNHGGDIVLDSKPGIGTVVTFTLRTENA